MGRGQALVIHGCSDVTAMTNGTNVEIGPKGQEPPSISSGNISFVVRVLAKLLQMALAFCFS